MNPYHHAVSSAKRYGGEWQDYHAIHAWFDESKGFYADARHRALRHHSEGILLCEQLFGPVVRNTAGRDVPSRFVGEQHVLEDCGWIPTVADWLKHIQLQPWMQKVAMKSVDL